jgi:S1-C subfamily serine protease
VGFPNIGLQGFAPKLAKGEVAALTGAADDPRYFQISVPVQPGNSGGALVDERGNVVGVVSAKLNASAALQTSGALLPPRRDQLRREEQFSPELPRIRARSVGQTQGTPDGRAEV